MLAPFDPPGRNELTAVSLDDHIRVFDGLQNVRVSARKLIVVFFDMKPAFERKPDWNAISGNGRIHSRSIS